MFSETKLADAERRHLVSGGVLFFNLVWVIVFSASLYLPWAIVLNVMG